ncbi:Uncharacterised protein [Chlamydia trachomatis]|nr:Uncharacterised protein [Chlamydia trachomatis]
MQFATLLVTINRTKLSDTQWKIFVRTRFARKYFTVMRTVHGLQHVLLVFLGCTNGLERVFAIVGIVSTGDIQILTANMRSDDLLIAKTLLNFAQHLLQTQAKFCSFWQPNRQSLAHTVREHE